MTEILFDFFDLLVNNIFGSVGLALVGVGVVMLLILFFTRAGKTFIIFWMAFYILVMGTMYIGALALVLEFIFAVTYLAVAIIRFAFRSD